MALKGTLKDFGIADILNLIGQQKKTGVLHIKSRAEQVEVSFLEGNVVRALSQTRRTRELIGTMLVRAELVTEEQLEKALEIQKRTLKRLGDILVAEGAVAPEQLREMTELQTTETLFKLFSWKNGTYEFVQQDVERDASRGTAIRPESVLMEGFRRIDEWPMVRKVVCSDEMTFEKLKHLDPPPVRPDADGEELDAAFDAAMGGGARREDTAPRSIGRAERLVFKLAGPGVTVRRLCDLSRAGDFATQKALFNLVQAGYLGPVEAGRVQPARAPSAAGSALSPGVRAVLGQRAVQASMGLVLVLLFAVAARVFGPAPSGRVLVAPARSEGARGAVVDVRRSRLQAVLELYRLERGAYPARLQELAERGLVAAGELSHPFDREFHYRADGDAYVLLPPLP